LKKIREAMGTEPFPQMLFDKVYKDDITRLRSMEEMWEGKDFIPEPIDYATTTARAEDTVKTIEQILKADQKPWTLEENVLVFKNR
jgi:ubiquitin-like 1-activating enzyme E1 B